MKIVETKGKIAEDGSIILPPGVLKNMNMAAGDTVSLTYLTNHPVQAVNTYGELLITQHGIDHISEPIEASDAEELSIPHSLLEAAGLPLDGNLDIQCADGSIMISSGDPLLAVPPQLMELFDDLGISHDAIRTVLMEGGFEDEQ